MRIFFDTEFLEDGTTIQPISIGMVREDGEEYYAEWPLTTAVEQHPWLKENVVPHLTGNSKRDRIIKAEIVDFVGGGEPEFWAYCAAYDWVLLNQMFGSMVDHPKQWPFYCNDIAQYGLHLGVNRRAFPPQDSDAHNALNDARWTRDTWLWLHEQDRW